MTYPFPMPVVPFRHKTETTAKEADAFYETHAEPIPRWLRAIVALPRRAIAAISKRKSETQADASAVQPVTGCRGNSADRDPAPAAYSPGTKAMREEALFRPLSSQTSRSNPVA